MARVFGKLALESGKTLANYSKYAIAPTGFTGGAAQRANFVFLMEDLAAGR